MRALALQYLAWSEPALWELAFPSQIVGLPLTILDNLGKQYPDTFAMIEQVAVNFQISLKFTNVVKCCPD